MIQKIGWRASYCAIGAFGLFSVLCGAIGLKNSKNLDNVQSDIDKAIHKEESLKGLTLKERKSSRSFIKQLMELNKNPVCRNVFMAGLLRTFGSTVVMAFSPIFFLKAFP